MLRRMFLKGFCLVPFVNVSKNLESSDQSIESTVFIGENKIVDVESCQLTIFDRKNTKMPACPETDKLQDKIEELEQDLFMGSFRWCRNQYKNRFIEWLTRNFALARKIVCWHMQNDKALYQAYHANIAMCLYDFKRENCSYSTRQELATEIMKVLFDADKQTTPRK